jgi:uncharacterized protein YggE
MDKSLGKMIYIEYMNFNLPNGNRQFLSQILITIITVVVSVASVILTAQFLGPLPLSLSQTISQKQDLFTVTGDSEVTTVPDQVEITFGVSQTDSQLAVAQDKVNQVVKNMTAELQKLGIKKEDIKTQNYSIYPQYDYQSEQRKITGYSVDSRMRVKLTDFEMLNQAIDVSTAQGANQVGGIEFSLSEKKEDELKNQAREEAIDKAKESAKDLANLAGVRLGKVVNVYEQRNNYYPSPMYAKAEMALDSSMAGLGGGEATQIEPGESTYTYSVTLSYETL